MHTLLCGRMHPQDRIDSVRIDSGPFKAPSAQKTASDMLMVV